MKLVIKPKPEDIKYYAILEIILGSSDESWEVGGPDVIACLGELLGLASDNIDESEDGGKFDEMIRRVARNRNIAL